MDYLTLLTLAAENPHGRLKVTREPARTHFVYHAKCLVAVEYVISGVLAVKKVNPRAALPAPCWFCNGKDYTPWTT